MRLCVLLAAAQLALAQTAQIPEAFRPLVELSRAAPGEFAADAMLRLEESGRIQDAAARRELVEEAFRLAVSAKAPIRKRFVPGSTYDTSAGPLAQVHNLKLDTWSLQSRAVSDMLRIDPTAARKLLQDKAPPVFDALSCDDPFFYEVGDFYQALGAVVNGAFTAEERAKEEHVNFLLGYIGQAVNPAQLYPLARTIQGASVNNAQRDVLWARFNAMLPNLNVDDRSMSALTTEPPQGMDFILTSMKQRSAGCKNDVQQQAPGTVAMNGVQAKSGDPTPKLDRWWQSAEAKRMLEDGRKLRFSDDGRVLTQADRSTPQWQQRLTDYLSALGAWSASSENSEADYYNEKCSVYIALVELIPQGPQRDKMLEAFIDFISSSPLQQQQPVEWYNQAAFMLERVRINGDGEPAKVQEAFERSGSPILALQAALDKALGAKPFSWVTSSR
ncbi:MAG TPA: hypothetical protein VKG79_15740 [Bryobacteraceae bacterium]|nr:hypothetical protein [Bryobacteraceae bacterium]